MTIAFIFSLIIRIISGLSLIFNILALIVFCQEENKTTLSNIMSLQLNIVSFMTPLSYLIVVNTNNGLCITQTVLSTFGELSRLTVVTTILFLAQLNFITPNNAENKKTKYLIISGIVSWIFPITIGVLSVIYVDNTPFSDFCWISSDVVINIFYGIRFTCITIFFVLAIILVRNVKKYYSELAKGEQYDAFIRRIKIYTSVIIYNSLIYLLYIILDLLSSGKSNEIFYILYGITDILFCIISPLFIIAFLFNQFKWKDLKNLLICAKQERESNISSLLDYRTSVFS